MKDTKTIIQQNHRS